MGCGGSQHAEFVSRLDAAEERLKAIPRGKKNEGMPGLQAVAEEICQIFKELIDAGAKDRESMRRVEVISDSILDHLVGRLTSEDLKDGREVCKEWLDNVEKVAKMLDAVRATKASTAVSEQIDTTLKTMSALVEKAAEPELQKMSKGCEQLKKDQSKIVPIAEQIMECAQKANDAAPDSRKVTEKILQAIMALTGIILQKHAAWANSYGSCVAMLKIATDIDALATRLAGIVDNIWDPPLEPEVKKRQAKSAEEICKQQVKLADTALQKDQAGDAFNALSNLHAWWPLLKEVDGIDVQVAGIFSKISTYTSKEYAKCIGDENAMKNIKDFVAKVEALRAQYDGLPEAADGESSLGETLSAIEQKAAVEKALDSLPRLVTQFDKDKKACPAALQQLEVVASKWSSVAGDASLTEKLETNCSAVEKKIEEMVSKAQAEKIANYVKLASVYDDKRSRCEPAPSQGPLEPRIKVKGVAGYLKAVESSLQRIEAPAEKFDASICENLKAAADIVPEDQEKLRQRLAEAFKATDACLTQKFKSGLGTPDTNERKEVILMNFAEDVDKIRDGAALMELLFSDEGSSLAKRLEALKTNHVGELVDSVEGKVAAQDFRGVLDSLQTLDAVSATNPLGDDLRQRLQAAVGSVKETFVEACSQAAATADVKSIDDFEFAAPRIDDVIASLGFEPLALEATVLEMIVSAHVAIVQKILSSSSIDDGALVADELERLESLCQKETCSKDSRSKVKQLMNSLETPLVGSVMSASDAATLSAVTKCAAAADKVLSVVADGHPSGSMAQRIKIAKAVGAKLSEAQKELDKPEKMNPRTVVDVLQKLHADWEPVKDVEVCRRKLVEILKQFHGKLDEACKKALEAEGDAKEKKLEALASLAQSADKAQDALKSLSTGLECESFAGGISRALADEHLNKIEGELNKTSGMQPPELLKQTKGLAKIWKSMGEADDLISRWTETHGKIKNRMAESMDEAISSSNEGKKKALLHFAKEFDAACSDFSEGSLVDELKGKMES